jgi:HK97 gp10 family phage protein
VTAVLRVEGLKEVEQMLIDLGGKNAVRAMRGALFDAVAPIREAAKARAPVGSGALRETIVASFRQGPKAPGSTIGQRFAVEVGSAMRHRAAVALYNLAYKPKTPRKFIVYGLFFERGTKTMARRPFLVPALDAKKAEAIAIFARSIRERIAKIANRKTNLQKFTAKVEKQAASLSKQTSRVTKKTSRVTKKYAKKTQKYAKQYAKRAKKYAKKYTRPTRRRRTRR